MTRDALARLLMTVSLVAGVTPALVLAQPASDAASLRAGRVTVSAGLSWMGGYDIGEAEARLRGNGVGADAPPFVLFRAASSVEAAAGVDGRVSVGVTRSLAIEGGIAFARPTVATRVSADPELLAGATLDAGRLARYLFDVGATWQLPVAWAGGRLRPFVSGGGGYLRELYDERTLVETGRFVQAGAGARYFLRGGDGTRRAVGLRGDVRLAWRRDGVEFEGRTRRMPSLSLQLFVEP